MPLVHLLTNELANACADLKLTGQPVLVGVSGGADSVALLCGLAEQQLTLHAAHLNHALRGAAADDDAAWVARLCEKLSIPCTLERIAVAERAEAAGHGIEETARNVRYEFLQRTATTIGCRTMAVAHSADDQAETILHHILRGTGLSGLRGIPVERELDGGQRLVRPLLSVTRATILDYLSHRGQDFREDESNHDAAYTRNRIRHSLLPQLEREYNPQLREALWRLSQQAIETQAALSLCATEFLEAALESAAPTECRLKWQPLARLPRHLLREVLLQLWRQQGWPRQAMTFAHWERLADLVCAGGRADFPGNLAGRRDGRLFIIAQRARQAADT